MKVKNCHTFLSFPRSPKITPTVRRAASWEERGRNKGWKASLTITCKQSISLILSTLAPRDTLYIRRRHSWNSVGQRLTSVKGKLRTRKKDSTSTSLKEDSKRSYGGEEYFPISVRDRIAVKIDDEGKLGLGVESFRFFELLIFFLLLRAILEKRGGRLPRDFHSARERIELRSP